MLLLCISVDMVHAGGGMPPPDVAITPDMFITIGMKELIFLLMLGLFGGMLSGFIGSGGAFVLTPGMMAIGAPGAIAGDESVAGTCPPASHRYRGARAATGSAHRRSRPGPGDTRRDDAGTAPGN